MNESRIPNLEDYPIELLPTFTTPKANDPVILISDEEMLLRRDTSTCFQGQGRIALEWLPRPLIRFHVDSTIKNKADVFSSNLLGEYELVTKMFSRSFRAHVAEVNISSNFSDVHMQGQVINEVFPLNLEIGSALFSLANFNTTGRHVRDATGCSIRTARSELEADGWKITLDAIQDQNSKLQKGLIATGGYGITHTGLIERIDKSTFRSNDLKVLLEDLFWFFSFCRGFKTVPLLVKMFDKGQTNRWLHMSCPTIDPWQTRMLWFDNIKCSLAAIFPGFIRRVRLPMWTTPIRNAIHWYLEAQAQAGAVEGAIVFGQTALEMLGWTLLVDERRLLSVKGYDDLPAADKMRILLSTCGIPLEIPAKLTNLSQAARAENWQDGAQCVAEIRNAVVHANTKKRKKLGQLSFHAKIDTWQLCIWYLELVLLRLFDYSGEYANRMGSGQWKGENAQRVPWAKDDSNKRADIPGNQETAI